LPQKIITEKETGVLLYRRGCETNVESAIVGSIERFTVVKRCKYYNFSTQFSFWPLITQCFFGDDSNTIATDEGLLVSSFE